MEAWGSKEGEREGNYFQKPQPDPAFQDILGPVLKRGLQSTQLFCCFIPDQEKFFLITSYSSKTERSRKNFVNESRRLGRLLHDF